jgi:acetyl esterase/lipase
MQPPVDIDPLRRRLLDAERQHLRRIVDAIDVQAALQIVDQQPAGAAADIQRWPALALDDRPPEGPVRPLGVIAAQQIPGLGQQAAIFVVVGGGWVRGDQAARSRLNQL